MRVPAEDETEHQKSPSPSTDPSRLRLRLIARRVQFYHHGVFSLKCGHKLNHAILVTGYGGQDKGALKGPVSPDGPDDSDDVPAYWLVKNSWGPTWGDHGYVRLARQGRHAGHRGECGVLMSSVVPIVE